MPRFPYPLPRALVAGAVLLVLLVPAIVVAATHMGGQGSAPATPGAPSAQAIPAASAAAPSPPSPVSSASPPPSPPPAGATAQPIASPAASGTPLVAAALAPIPPPTPLVPPAPPPAPPLAPNAPPTPLVPPAPPPVPALAAAGPIVVGPLDGLPTPRELALRRPLAIMVENYAPDARPQTGLPAASVVFETVAEFGITRFMAVYQEHDAPVVGPVRSARVYYDHWADGLHAIFAHAGGNSDALRELWTLHDLANVDEVATELGLYDTGADYFFRSPDRLAPHNLYAVPARIRAHVAAIGAWTEGDPPWTLAHKAPAPLAVRPAGGVIDLAFSGPAYAVHYDYDRASNTYLRTLGGAPHVDAVSGARLAATNVALLLAGVSPDYSADTLGSVIVQSEGAGPAYYFMDGTVRQGTWRKDGIAQPLRLLDAAGGAVAFDPGQTWIEVVPQGTAVSWTAPAVK